MMTSHMIDIYRTIGGKTVKETLEAYHDNQLKELAEPMHLIEESQIFKSIPSNNGTNLLQ